MPPSDAPGRSRDVRAIALLIIVAALFGALVLPRFGVQQRLGPAPDFTLPVIYNGDDGSRIRLGDLKGHVIVLDFWASWCKPCRAQTPILKDLAARADMDEVVIVGIATSDREANSRKYAAQEKINYTVAYDEGDVARQYGAYTLPTVVVVDAEGQIVRRWSGVVPTARLESAIEDAGRLPEPPASPP